MSWYGGFRPYVSVAQRRAQAAREVAKRLKRGEKVSPVVVEGRKITTTFWGQAWCENLEGYSDFASRLPRGRTYVRNGSVVDLKIEKGRIRALVSGSELYDVDIEIAPVSKAHWLALKRQCAGQIGSLVELLQGKLSKSVMELVTDRERGLFPKPGEIKMECSCPDYAGMCKHLAAVLYGVGHRLDSAPELLFTLRGVDQAELIEQAIPAAPAKARRGAPTIAPDDLGSIFGIEIDEAPAAKAVAPARGRPTAKEAAKAPGGVKKPTAAKKAPAAKASDSTKKASAVKKTKKPPARKKG